MKLSEAIRMNGMTKPQGFENESFYSNVAPCALGGALLSIGRPQTYLALFDSWPWITAVTNCPCEHCTFACYRVAEAIWHLNDQHAWTRQQIANWVETVEPQEVDEVVPVVEEVLTHQ